jgi:hypothetical protein
MNRRITVLTVCALLFTLCFSAHAQEPKKIARIGYLSAFEPGTESTRSELFRQALRERGYV